MAVLQALLKIQADVTGQDRVARLGQEIGGLTGTAGKATGTLKTAAVESRNFGSAINGLGLAVSSIGLGALVGNIANSGFEAQRTTTRINALAGQYNEVAAVEKIAAEAASQFALGTTDARNSIADLYGRLRPTGVSLKDIETVFFGVNKAAKVVGLSTTDVNEVLLQLSQALGSGRLQGDELRSIMERMPAVGQAVAKVMGVTTAEVKELGSQGKITTDVMIKAAAELNKITPPAPTAMDQFNKSMADLRTELGENLVPILTPFIQALTGALKIFTALPEPVQTVIVGLGLLTAALAAVAAAATVVGPGLVSIATALGSLKIGAIVAGWAGAIGPAVAAITAALSGLLAWIGATLVPGMLAFFSGPIGWTVLAVAAVVAMAIAFREPLMEFAQWLWQWGEPIRQFWIDLWDETQRVFATAGQRAWDTFYNLMISPWLAVWDTLKGPLEAFWQASQAIFQWGAKAAYAVVWQLLIQPWLNVWKLLDDPVTDLWRTISKLFTSGAAAAMGVIDAVIVRPWQGIWSGLQSAAAQVISWLSGAFSGIGQAFNQYVASPIATLWRGVTDGIANGMRSAADFVQGIWTGLVNGLTGLARSFVTGWVSAINAVVSAVNRLITGFNQLPGPDIALIPTLSVPAFAQGGVVTQPTLAMVGDGGEPEYIIPQSKMAAASAAFAGGARGAAVLNGSSFPAGTAAPVVNIQTGPVMQADGKNWVTVDDLQRAVQQATGQVYSQLRTPRGRRAVGIA